jgi:DNA-binding transcriptional ArsR family regulator
MHGSQPDLMARIFKTLADPTRLRLLGAMTLDCKSVSQLVEESGLSQPLVSHHLRILREAGLAKSGRRGIYMLY